jgi:hypothetical protein
MGAQTTKFANVVLPLHHRPQLQAAGGADGPELGRFAHWVHQAAG